MAITKEQWDILDHTAHRSAAGRYCGDSDDMKVLVSLGMMCSLGTVSFCSDEFFGLTALGRKELKNSPNPQ